VRRRWGAEARRREEERGRLMEPAGATPEGEVKR